VSGVVILSAVRTAYGRLLGSLAEAPPASLGGWAAAAAVERAGIRPDEIDRIILGNVSAHALRGNPAAAAAKHAGLAPSIPAFTVRAGCASSLFAGVTAIESILSGQARVTLVGGFESASSTPHLALGLRRGLRLGGGSLLDAARHDGPVAAAVGAEDDLTAFRTHGLPGSNSSEIVAVEIKEARRGSPARVERDDARRELEENPEAFGSHLAPILADGAAALVLASEEWTRARGLRPAARVRSAPPSAAKSEITGFRYIEADLPDREAVTLAAAITGDSRKIVNVGGGGAVLGHASGADGARLVVTLLHLLMRGGGGKGLALATGGWGESAGIIVEV